MRLFGLFLVILGLGFSACSEAIDKSETDVASLEKSQKATVYEDGPYLVYHETGEIKIVGEYKNGKRTGLWTSWFATGEIQSEVNYESDLENGEYKVFYANGNLKIKGFYNKGKASGVWLFYAEDGTQTNTKDYDA